MLLSTLSSCVPVDIMPGDNDPANRSFPQQPLHSSLFKNTNLSDVCCMATNPHYCAIDNLRYTILFVVLLCTLYNE